MLRPAGWLLVLTLFAAPAFADPKADASKAFGEGKTKYAAGDYAGAAKDFKLAYDLDSDPAYLFNLAQAYRLAEDCEAARDAYAKFLGLVPNPPNKDAVTGWLDDAKKCAAAKQPKDPPPPPKDPPPPPKDPPPKHDTPKKPGAPVLAYASIGVGVVAIGVGAYFTTQVFANQSDHEDCSKTPGSCDTGDIARFDRKGERAETRQWIGYGVGAVAIGAGTFLWMRHKKAEKSFAVAPTRDGAMVVTSFRF